MTKLPIIAQIYRSKKKEGMYLYTRKDFNLDELPEALRKQFGAAERAMTLMLDAQKKLAQADVEKVIASIESQGFYLQMPPTGIIDENYMRQIPNDKLGAS